MLGEKDNELSFEFEASKYSCPLTIGYAALTFMSEIWR